MDNKNKNSEEEKPHPSETIKPNTSKDTQIPDSNNKEEEKTPHKRKRIYKNKQNGADEQDSDGSANAFDGK